MMLRWLRGRLTFANVVSVLALLLALGNAPAWALQGMNTVFSDDIVNGQVKSLDIMNGGVGNADLADGSVDSGEVVDGSISGEDLADGSVDGAAVEDGSLGGGDIGNGSLTGDDMANESITGADVAEGTLAKVPSATQADVASSIGDDSVSTSSFGTVTRRAGLVTVDGNTAENGKYVTEEVSVLCTTGEMLLTWDAFWTVGQDADDELVLVEASVIHNGSFPVGVTVVGGNDTEDDTLLVVAVFCLAP